MLSPDVQVDFSVEVDEKDRGDHSKDKSLAPIDVSGVGQNQVISNEVPGSLNDTENKNDLA